MEAVMSNFVSCTPTKSASQNPVSVNLDQVLYMERTNRGTEITFSGGGCPIVIVKEEPDAILSGRRRVNA